MAIKKARQLANEERNNKIENMNIDELKKYLCMKNGQNPEKCDGCTSVKTCVAGQRAVVLMNERKRREAEEMPKQKKPRKNQIAQIRQTFAEACQQEDMIGWLMARDGISRDAAKVKLKYWAKAQPDIAEQYWFKEKYDRLIAANIVDTHRVNPWNERQREKARAEYIEAMKHDDPASWIAEKRGIERKNAVVQVSKWKKLYGPADAAKQPDTTTDSEPENSEEKESAPMAQDSGEVSIEDFLNEVAETENPEGNAVTVDGTTYFRMAKPEEKVHDSEGTPTITPAGAESETAAAHRSDMRGELEDKYVELQKELEQLDEEIDRMQKRRGWIVKAQDALAMTINLFDPDSAIGKDFWR